MNKKLQQHFTYFPLLLIELLCFLSWQQLQCLAFSVRLSGCHAVRPSGRVSQLFRRLLSRPSMTLTSKAKLLVSMVRPQKYLQALTL